MPDPDPAINSANFAALEYAILNQALTDYWGMDLRAKKKMAASTFKALREEAGAWLEENYPYLKHVVDSYEIGQAMALKRATRAGTVRALAS